jgi:chromosome segregation ATPase
MKNYKFYEKPQIDFYFFYFIIDYYSNKVFGSLLLKPINMAAEPTNAEIMIAINRLGNDVGRFGNDVGQLNHNVGQLNHNVGQLNNDVGQLGERMNDTETAITEQGENLVRAAKNLDKLATVIIATNQKVNDTSNRTDKLETDGQKSQKEIDAINIQLQKDREDRIAECAKNASVVKTLLSDQRKTDKRVTIVEKDVAVVEKNVSNTNNRNSSGYSNGGDSFGMRLLVHSMLGGGGVGMGGIPQAFFI